MHASGLFHKVDDVARGVWLSKGARARRKLFELLRMVEQRENFAGEPFGGEFWLSDQFSRAGFGHGFGVAKLMAVGGAAERNKDRCPTGSSDFGSSDGPRAADDQ